MRSLRQIIGNNSVQFFNSLINFMSEFGFVADKTAQEAYDEMVSGGTSAKITVNFVWNNDYTITVQTNAKNATNVDRITTMSKSATNLPSTSLMGATTMTIGENNSVSKPTSDGYRQLNAYVVKNENAWFIQFGSIGTTVPNFNDPVGKPVLFGCDDTIVGNMYSTSAFDNTSDLSLNLKNGTSVTLQRFYQYSRADMCDYSEYMPYFVGGNYAGALNGLMNTSYTSLATYYELENGKNFFEVTAGLAIAGV